ncbi:MAG: hypothetical protein RI897_3297 [Verrucomicrobiota bacterium]
MRVKSGLVRLGVGAGGRSSSSRFGRRRGGGRRPCPAIGGADCLLIPGAGGRE